MLHHGPVRVPKDAQPGKVNIRVELPESSKYQSIATDTSVELVKEKDGK